MTRSLVFITLFLGKALMSVAQDTAVSKEDASDRYVRYVSQLETGNTNIDYLSFRQSFWESQRDVLNGKVYKDLQYRYFSSLHKGDHAQSMQLGKALLMLNYTYLNAHEYLENQFRKRKDTANWKKHHSIRLGLVNSILNSGDGKSCETGWHVMNDDEVHFVLRTDLKPHLPHGTVKQRINDCYRFLITNRRTYHFNISKIIEAEKKLTGE